MRKILCLFLIAITGNSYAQLKGSTYQFPERFTSNYFFDPTLSFQKIKDVQISGFTEDQMNYYKVAKTYNVQRDFDDNTYYLEWNELEKYLYKLVDTLMPITIKAQQPYDVFIKRDIDYNASALGNGFVYANIGLLANCASEAELAFVLSHEIGHSIFNHGYMVNAAFAAKFNSKDYDAAYDEIDKMYAKSRFTELQADSFAYKCILKAGFNHAAVLPSLNMMQYSEFVSQFFINKSSRGGYKNYMQVYSTHPNATSRKDLFYANLKNNPSRKNYLIDSVYFNKIKKIAHEECKKISFETGDYDNSLKLSFIDYLQGDNGLKNLFYILESIRRLMYRNPDICNRGFLAEDLQFTEFKNTNYSVLKLPDILFDDSLQLVKAIKHPLITDPDKPFNTYEQAYLYFNDLCVSKNLNDANFSKALYYYFKKDDALFKEHLLKYSQNGGGIYTEFANNLAQNGYPLIKEGKTNLLIDNSTNFSHNDNYFHSLQRTSYNTEINALLKKDSTKVDYLLMNELLGVRPRLLYNYQKLKWNIYQLYSEKDEEKFYKKRYLAKDGYDENTYKNKYNKNLMIYAPEWYKWFSENHYTGILYQRIIYEYPSVLASEEFHNTYDLIYLNFFDNRPYFSKSTRNSTLRKQKTIDMIMESRDYLLKKD